MKRPPVGVLLIATALCSLGIGAAIPSLTHRMISTHTFATPAPVGSPSTGNTSQALASGSSLNKQTTPADSPQSVIVASFGTNDATLSWIPSSHATQYLVYRGTSPNLSNAQVVAQTSSNRFDDTNLQPNTVYYYWVAGSNQAGVASPSRCVSFETYDSWSDIRQKYAQSVVKVLTYNTIWGVFGSGTVGTGFVVQGGYIVTNYHIIDRWNWAIDVFYANGTKKFHARIVHVDKAHDLAVLQIVGAAPPNVAPVPLCDALPQKGDNVAVMGYPANRSLAFTTGTVNDVHSTVNVSGDGLSNVTLRNLIATNARSVKGNSGSPLFNRYGQAVGVMESESVNGSHIAYAVPARVLAQWGIQ